MKVNHLGLLSSDVVATRDFLTKYLGLGVMVEGNVNVTFLKDDNGMVITLFRNAEVSYPEGFHIGFIQESKERVNEINARLKADGLEVDAPKDLHGSYTFYMKVPGGLTIEVLC